MSKRSFGVAAGLTALLSTAAVGVVPGSAVAQQYPPTAPPPSTPPGCQVAEARVLNTTITATGSAGVTVTAAPGSTVDLFAYTRPSTSYRLVRTGTAGANGEVTFPALVPPGNTRLYPQQRGCALGQSRVINVRTALSLSVTRTDDQTFRFFGDSMPARQGGLTVSLYRVTANGRQVLTSQARANASDGEWVINRRFTGTGRFGFVLRTGQDLQSAPGSSNIRSLLIF